MKTKLALLLIIIGGALFGVVKDVVDELPPIIISILGGFLIGFSFMLFTSIYSGKVWGIKIKGSSLSKVKVLIGAVGLIIGGFSIVYTFLTLIGLLFSGEFVAFLINLVAYIVAWILGPIVAKIYLEKTLVKGSSASVLGKLDIFKEVDANIEKASYFVAGFEGVALFSETNYCYAVYLYEDYQLGELTSPEEVALVGTYFVQKYGDKFTFKVDVEVIPGEPGRTVVAVGTGGIGVGRIQGTPDQHLFRSYIFKRK